MVLLHGEGQGVRSPVHRGDLVRLEIVMERGGSTFIESDQEDVTSTNHWVSSVPTVVFPQSLLFGVVQDVAAQLR